MSRVPDEQSEIERLRARLQKLEVRQADQEREASRWRTATAGLVAGAVALVLSLSLPWARSDSGWHASFDDEGVLRFGHSPARREVTGWQFYSAGIDQEHLPMVLAVLAVLLVAVAALVTVLTQKGWTVRAAVAAGAVLPFVLLLMWPHSGARDAPVAGGGVWVAVFGGLLVACAALYTLRENPPTSSHPGAPR